MVERIMELEPVIRLGFLFGMVAVMGLWELAAPRRALTVGKAWRWANNIAIIGAGTLLSRIVLPAGAVGVALFADARGWGLLPELELPFSLIVVIAVVVLDFAVWAQHVFFHAVPVLWRLHRMHHADLDFDLTTGLRFHPLEILLSFGIKALFILALGAPVIAVLIFEVVLNALALFNHANVCLPRRLDAVLRWLIVTPDFHRVHHSWYPHETNTNFGFNLSLWDRLFGTYRAQPRDGHEHMMIGLNQFRDPVWERFDRLLIQPFVGPVHSYPIQMRPDTDAGSAQAVQQSRNGES